MTDVIYSVNELDIEATIVKDVPLIMTEDHHRHTRMHKRHHYLNRAVRKEGTILFAGDLPTFAFGTTLIKSKNDPPMISLGEFAFSIVTDDGLIPLCSADKIKVVHKPNGSCWQVMGLEISSSLMPENGICALISSKEPVRLAVEVSRQRVATRNNTASWFNDDSPLLPCRLRQLSANVFEVESSKADYYGRALIGFTGRFVTTLGEGLYVEFDLQAGETLAVSAIHSAFDEEGCTLCETWQEAKERQEEEGRRLALLAQSALVTSPDKIFNSGVAHSILSLDYCHFNHAWLEGGHWWSCHWANNFQISAAIALGQQERARRALLFFGSLSCGYAATSLTGENLDPRIKRDGSIARGYDGMPYYLNQLWQYTESYGDYSLLEQVFDNIHLNNLDMIELCDPDMDNLYSWHKGCNAFMYQADHHAVPGAGLSPSVMIAWGFEKLAIMLERIGRAEAGFYAEKARMTWEALHTLWDEEMGYYLSSIDLGGSKIRAHYYTDLVFPVLYSDVPAERKISLLCELQNSLVFESAKTGLPLMRVGKLKPDLFGNNNVMPVQMCEAAMALFEMGMAKLAYGLLKSCGLATAVFTESPGSAPERLNDEGKGEANYMFGNPAAALPYAVIRGLFGISVKDGGKLLRYAPAKLGEDLSIHHSLGKFSAGDRGYTFALADDSAFEQVEFSICVPRSHIPILTCNGERISFTQSPVHEGIRINTLVPAAKEMEFKLTYRWTKLDISAHMNSEHAIAINGWRGHQAQPVLISRTEDLTVDTCTYKLKQNKAGAAMLCSLEKGRSREELGIIEPAEGPSTLSIPIVRKISAMALLYSSETDARLSGEPVGEITLEYEDGKHQKILLQSGKNFGSILNNYAKDCVHVPFLNNANDSVNHYLLNCDPNRSLKNVSFAINKEDVHMGLIAVNIYEEDNHA